MGLMEDCMTDIASSSVDLHRKPLPTDRRVTRPVQIWAVVGGAWLALTAYCWVSWLVQGHARPSPHGPTPIPTWQWVSAWSWQVFFTISGLIALYIYVIRPARRTGHLSFDGLFALAWACLWALQDPWADYTVQQFNYSNVPLNLGCPQCHVPGWQANSGTNFAEPLLIGPGMYLAFFVAFSIWCNKFMAACQRRWPRLGNFGLVLIAIGFMIFWDTVIELFWIRTGMYHMGGGIRWLTLFHGHWYQMPVNENLLWGVTWGLIAALRYFKNDRGETLAERGLHHLDTSPRTKQGLRFLALVGIMNTIMFVFFNVPHQWFSTHADYFPDDVVDKSWFTNQMCGIGTDYACPGPRVPIPVGPDSGHATPSGDFDAPAGLPVQVSPDRGK
jgi:Spirocyclase AveC-like